MVSSPLMKRYVLYRAGPDALELIRQEGLKPERVAVYAGPAGGPKWFVSVGFDRTLMRTGFLLNRGERVLLAGASAGAWRCLAMACREPADAYERLRIAYSRNVFTREDTPATVSAALKRNVESFIHEQDIPYILEHSHFDLAVHTVRAKGPAASANRRIEGFALIVAALCNALWSGTMDLFYERVVFYAGTGTPRFAGQSFDGRIVRLTRENLRPAALATGSLPYIVAGVREIPDAEGVYRDGGLRDYQLNQDYCPGQGALTLFFHYQERISPGWFDKRLPWRRPPRKSLERLFQVYPGPDFLGLLPDGRLPDRNDFVTFVDNPHERIRRWDHVCDQSEVLGEQFMEDLESGKIRKLVEPLAMP